MSWLFENIALCILEIMNHYELPAMSFELFTPQITDLIKDFYVKRSLSVFLDFNITLIFSQDILLIG